MRTYYLQIVFFNSLSIRMAFLPFYFFTLLPLNVFREVFFYHEVVYDEVLSFGCVLAHVVFEELLHLVRFVERHLFEAHLRTDEIGELVGRNLAKTFKSGYLRVGTQLADGFEPLVLAVTVAGYEVALLAIAFCRRLCEHALVFYLRAAVAYPE